MSVCVCGHPPGSHRPAVMSVPLSRKMPIYPVPASVNSVAATHPHATYDREECGCGCCQYLSDGDG